MQDLIVFIKRALLTWLLLVGSIMSFDVWLVLASAFSGYTGELRVGIPYAYYVQEPLDPWSEGDPPVADEVETEALQVNVAVMGALALVSTIFWPSRSPSKVPSMPSPVAGSTPPADVAKRDEPQIAALDRRSRRCLRLTIAGSLLGLGLIFGGFGWRRGRKLSMLYLKLGRVPPWTAAAAWATGRGILCATVIGILGMIFAR